MLADSAWQADWEGALETLQDMRSLGVTPDVTSDLVQKMAQGARWARGISQYLSVIRSVLKLLGTQTASPKLAASNGPGA